MHWLIFELHLGENVLLPIFNESKESKRNFIIDSSSLCTVNSEIFARVLFSRNFACAKFPENKTLAKSL